MLTINKSKAADRLQDILPQIAKLWGEDWTVTIEDETCTARALFTRKKDGLSLRINAATRATAVINWPDMPNSRWPANARDWHLIAHDEKEPSASFDLNRAPSAIAKQLRRQLVDLCEDKFALALKRRAETIDRLDQMEDAAQRIASALGVNVRTNCDDERTIHRYCHGQDRAAIDFRLSGRTAEIKIQFLTHENAVALAEFIRSRNEPF